MPKKYKPLFAIAFFFTASFLLSSYNSSHLKEPTNSFKMPYKKAGLTDRQAAAHLLNRFTFGATPKAIDQVVNMGLEKWFSQQLEGKLDDNNLNERLQEYDALKMSNTQVLEAFPRGPKVLKEAVAAGLINKDSLDKTDKAAYKDKLQAYMEQKGYRPEKELLRQFVNQKILSAAYSNNQLHQVLTEFWFNHFNVSATKNDCAQFIPVYEREAIRPNVTGKFADLLMATAQSPAMLFYLDNFSSAGINEDMERRQQKLQQLIAARQTDAVMEDSSKEGKELQKIKKNKNNQGLNENYAREIMELHTLGVDGGYTQQDVTQAARVLTGWTVYPMSDYGPSKAIKKIIDKVGEDNLIARGFVHKGDFFFAMNRHDNKEKTVLGKTFSNGGCDEGVQLISLLAHHPATAKFICKKLAVRFVSDNPSQSIIDKMAASFAANDGDIKQVLISMVSSPEFWQKDALREKTKSPFELAISAVRTLDAEVKAPFMLYQWITKMGQKLYYYQAPTGFPDKAQYWINTGSLLNRMNFGLAFASQKIPGISFNLAAINNNREPESAVAALTTYSKLIMPERNLDATIKRLTPLINDPAIQQKINEAAVKSGAVNDNTSTMNSNEMTDDGMKESSKGNRNRSEEKLAKQLLRKNGKGGDAAMASAPGNNSMLAQVVGIILGSPEFQRR